MPFCDDAAFLIYTATGNSHKACSELFQMRRSKPWVLEVNQLCRLESADLETLISAARIMELSDFGGRIEIESDELPVECQNAILRSISGSRLENFRVVLTKDESPKSMLFYRL